METIVDDPGPSVMSQVKKNKQEYSKVIKDELKKEFKIEDSGLLFPSQRKEGIDYYVFSLEDSMGETSAVITFPDSEKNKEKEKLAKEVAGYISKFVEKDSKIKNIKNGSTTSGDIANAMPDSQNGNWTVRWRPQFFLRKQN
jgi:hypothetical protein